MGIIDVHIYGYDDKKDNVIRHKATAVIMDDDTYRIELHDKNGSVAFAFLKKSDFRKTPNLVTCRGNKNKTFPVNEQFIYGRYPTVRLSGHYESKYMERLKSSSLIK